MVNAILITGNTYPHRRALRSAGALFDYEEKGYVAKVENKNVLQIAKENNLTIKDYQATDDQLTPATGERLRKIRQDKINRKRDRLYKQADAADKRADKALNRISDREREFLSLAEPIKVGHHSEKKHRKLIERSRKSIDDAGNEWHKADRLRQQADGMLPARVKGDAERERQKLIEIADKTISPGDLVHSVLISGNKGIVVKKNKKTFTLRSLETNDLIPIDKHYCTLLEKRAPEKYERKFKKGDEVIYNNGSSKYSATVIRKTPNGYKIKYSLGNGLSEREIRARESELLKK